MTGQVLPAPAALGCENGRRRKGREGGKVEERRDPHGCLARSVQAFMVHLAKFWELNCKASTMFYPCHTINVGRIRQNHVTACGMFFPCHFQVTQEESVTDFLKFWHFKFPTSFLRKTYIYISTFSIIFSFMFNKFQQYLGFLWIPGIMISRYFGDDFCFHCEVNIGSTAAGGRVPRLASDRREIRRA